MSVALRIASGDGWLARRADGVVFATGEWSEVLAAFCAAESGEQAGEAVTSAAVEASFEVPSFVVVTWGDRVECIVFGDVELRTEDPSAPMLTGAGSSTWIERRLRTSDASLRVWAGAPAVAGSSLHAGIVPAGGFELVLDDVGHPASPSTQPDPLESRDEPAQDPAPGSDDDPAGLSEPAAAVPPVANEHAVAAKVAGIEALVAATGGDWMEESLGLRGAGRGPTEPPGTARGTVDDFAGDPSSESGAPDAGGDPIRHAASDASTGEISRIAVPPGLDDDESTWVPTGPAPPEPSTLPPPSLPLRGPVVATAVLPDGSAVAVDGTLVLGRNPNRAAARADDDARLVVVASANSVSRTHVVVQLQGSALTATDCGSRGGVVVVTPGKEPLMLEPWVPQEIAIGDTLYLGGPNGVHIVAPSGAST